MRWLSQIVSLTVFNVKTLPRRKGSAAAAIFGIAGVVAVLVGVLSIGRGFRAAMTGTGSADTALVFRTGADSEMTSILSREEIPVIEAAPGIARAGGQALVSPELFVIVNLLKKSTGTDANVPLRGVEQTAFLVRPEIEIVEGRRFEPGRNEIIVGRGAQAAFSGLDVGSKLTIGRNQWDIVGLFEADGGLAESELWADAAILAPAYRRGSSFQVAVVQLASAGSFQQFKDALTSDPRVNVKVEREDEYYASQSRALSMLVTGLGTLIAGLMAVGAIFGALNTMYTAVAARTREIGTLKALGFSASPVVFSVILESLVLAMIGGLVGAVAAWVIFDGVQTSTLNWQSFSQVAFAFRVDAALLVQGIIYSLVIGLVGGLFPAIRAARLPISEALREP